MLQSLAIIQKAPLLQSMATIKHAGGITFLLEILCDDLLERLSELDLPSDLRRHGRSVLLQSKPTSP